MHNPKNYIIDFTLKSYSGSILKKGKARTKNKNNQFEAIKNFENWLREKYPTAEKLVVHDCYEDSPLLRLLKKIDTQKSITI